MGAKGGDKDWYGYCVDAPVSRSDAWKVEKEKTGRGACLLHAPSAFWGTPGRVFHFSP